MAALLEVENLQDEIEKEYMKEFPGEGQMFFYYKRLNRSRIGVYTSVNSVDDAIYRLPIPTKEIEYGKIEN